jgi:hypothetical protein
MTGNRLRTKAMKDTEDAVEKERTWDPGAFYFWTSYGLSCQIGFSVP